ncbi:MobF family relaxase [Burkholderia multivorans]|uniref:MobF family relaxase n=1 Tax=Burkholderia multivorans TaxID=87883 RepID=UPI0020B29C93|nr:MobF family relaxase [Burkholderia multivorans]
MLSNAPIKNLDYYLNVRAQDDYYNKKDSGNKEGIGTWSGKGAEALNLVGIVEKTEFLRIMNGRNPHTSFSDKLSKYVRDDTKRHGQDFTFSANKSFTLLYNSVDDNSQLKRDLDKLWKEANIILRDELEKNVQIRENGKLVPASGAVIGYWEHETSREEDGKIDPNKHNHNVIAQYAMDKNGNWKSVEFGNLFKNKILIDAKAQAHIAKGVRELGFEIVEDKHSWRIKGFNHEALSHFSGRRNKILKEAGKNASYRARQNQANVKNAKSDYNLSDLKQEWKDRLESFGFTPKSIESLRGDKIEIQKPVTKSDIIRLSMKLAGSKHFKKEHVNLAIEKKSETHDFDKQRMYDLIFPKNTNLYKAPSRTKESFYYDKEFVSDEHHKTNQKIDSEFQKNDIERLKSNAPKPSQKQIQEQTEKLSPKNNNQEVQQSSPSKPGLTASKVPSASKVGGSGGSGIQQSINELLASLHDARLSLGKIDISSPSYSEQMARIYALEQQLSSMASQKAVSEYQEGQQKLASERQQEEKQQEQQRERTR